jgi:hypothetical protein
MILVPADQLPLLPMLIVDVSREHSHRRTTREGGPIEREVSRPRRIRRRLAGLATAVLAVTR